jgi:hypothetical protein
MEYCDGEVGSYWTNDSLLTFFSLLTHTFRHSYRTLLDETYASIGCSGA